MSPWGEKPLSFAVPKLRPPGPALTLPGPGCLVTICQDCVLVEVTHGALWVPSQAWYCHGGEGPEAGSEAALSHPFSASPRKASSSSWPTSVQLKRWRRRASAAHMSCRSSTRMTWACCRQPTCSARWGRVRHLGRTGLPSLCSLCVCGGESLA